MPLIAVPIIILTTSLLFLGTYYVVRSYTNLHASHAVVTDKELLLLISNELDGLLSYKRAMALTGLKKSDLVSRLNALSSRGIIGAGYSNGFKKYYFLKQPIAKGDFPELSSDPFLTIGDLMSLFKHFDYKLTIQDICIVTNLPIKVIKKEIQHFLKSKVIEKVHLTAQDGNQTGHFYILGEEYRDNPEKYISVSERINLDLSKIYDKLNR